MSKVKTVSLVALICGSSMSLAQEVQVPVVSFDSSQLVIELERMKLEGAGDFFVEDLEESPITRERIELIKPEDIFDTEISPEDLEQLREFFERAETGFTQGGGDRRETTWTDGL